MPSMRKRFCGSGGNGRPTILILSDQLGEASFRSLSWIWAYHILKGSPDPTDFRDDWLRGLERHGRHIVRCLSTYFSPDTWLWPVATATSVWLYRWSSPLGTVLEGWCVPGTRCR
jgi:hypothetical protein